MTVSCAGGKKRVNKKSILKGKHTIDVVKKAQDDPYLAKKQLQHPFDFAAREIYAELISRKYQVFTIIGKNKYVFDKKLARRLSPYFVKAFKKAGKSEIISFTVHSSRGQIIGDMFIYRGKLHLRFNSIHGIPYESDDVDSLPENWILMLRKGEKYHKTPWLFGKKALKNWVISPLKAVSVKAPAIKEHKLDENTDEIQAKFTRLKFLLDKGIISKEEYNAKKKELMEKYF